MWLTTNANPYAMKGSPPTLPRSSRRSTLSDGNNVAVAEPKRDDFPNNFVGDLVPTEHGWVVVPPTCCPDGHDYSDGGWSVSAV